jgi:hypothetical protein
VTESGVIYAAQYWPTNAHMIADVAKLGYLDNHSLTLDATYGKGNFWTVWRPRRLISNDAHRTAMIESDFTCLPFADETFDRVVFDPPYKLNGRPSPSDYPYGVENYTRWQDRITLMRLGQAECARVVKKRGLLLTKCMDQVVSGHVRWQTDHMTRVAFDNDMDKVDRFLFMGDPREQPHDSQVHTRANYSSFLVFKKRR